MIGLRISIDWKRDSYNAIFVIIDHFTKMIYYKLMKITIDIAGLVIVIINMVVKYHNFFESIIYDRDLLFISKF